MDEGKRGRGVCGGCEGEGKAESKKKRNAYSGYEKQKKKS